MDGKYGQTEHTDTKYVSRRQSGCQFDEVSVTSLIDDVPVDYPCLSLILSLSQPMDGCVAWHACFTLIIALLLHIC